VPGPFPSSAVCGSLVCGVAFGDVLLFVVGVFVVGRRHSIREVTAGGDVAGILGGQGAGGLGGDRGTYLGLVVGHGSPRGVGIVGSGWDAVRTGWWWWWGEGRSDVATVARCFLIWVGAGPGPRVGYIYLSPLYKQAFMAQLVRALVAILLAMGSILMY